MWYKCGSTAWELSVLAWLPGLTLDLPCSSELPQWLWDWDRPWSVPLGQILVMAQVGPWVLRPGDLLCSALPKTGQVFWTCLTSSIFHFLILPSTRAGCIQLLDRDRMSSRGFLLPEQQQFLFPCIAISINYRIVNGNGPEGWFSWSGSSCSRKAWYLMCLLVCAVSQPLMFAAVNTRKANKMKAL